VRQDDNGTHLATLLRADSGRALVGGHDVVTSAAVVRQ
jgi:hypothetical protein